MKQYAGITQLMQNISNEAGIDYIALTNQITGGYQPAYLMFQKLTFWFERSKRSDGMIYKTNKDWSKELAISIYQVKQAKNRLKAIGIDWKIKKANGNPTTHFFVNFELLAKAIGRVIGDAIQNIKQYVLNFFNGKQSKEKKFSEKTDQSISQKTHQSIGEETNQSFSEKTDQTISRETDQTFGEKYSLSSNRTEQQNKKTEQDNKTNQPPESTWFLGHLDSKKESSSTGGGCEAQLNLLKQYKVSDKKAKELSKLPLYDLQCAVQTVKEMDNVKNFAGMLVTVIESGSYKQNLFEDEDPASKYFVGEWAAFLEH